MNVIRALACSAVVAVVIACFDFTPDRTMEPACDRLGAESAAVAVDAGDLVREQRHDGTALIVAGGTVRSRDGSMVLEAREKGYSPFFGLTISDSSLTIADMAKWSDRKVRVWGCYTSGDVQRPAVRGAAGMLQVQHIEHLQ